MGTSDARSTLQGIFNLISSGVFKSSIINIYVYLRLHSGEIIKYEDMVSQTGLHYNTIYKQITDLETASLIKRIKVGRSFRYTTRNISSISKTLLKQYHTPHTPSSSSSSRLVSSSSRVKTLDNVDNIESRKKKKRESECVILKDKDWIAAKAILARHIPESFIDPTRIGEKRFMKLCGLLLDESFDLEAYAKWYRVEKFVRLRFNWNIFLLSSMVDEYRAVADDIAESEQHLHTSSVSMKSKHSKAAKKDKEWIRKNIAGKVGKNGVKTRNKRSSTRDS